jgi:hypothetical protein
MLRRLFALVGTLAFALTILPTLPDSAPGATDCCNGIMCPMHKAEDHAANCNMDLNGSGAALKSCPVQAAVHYTATIVFVLLIPAGSYHEIVSGPATGLLPHFHSDADLRVDSPPPRLPLSS